MNQTMVQDRGFLLALLLAALIHIGVWSELPRFMPKAIKMVPVQMLQVKLGLEEAESAPPRRAPEPVERLVREQFSSGVLSERAARKLDRQMSAPKRIQQSIPQQFVRERKPIAQTEKGSSLGNTQQSSVEVLSAYTQTLSLWMQKFKVYPESARAAGMEGDAVVRIRIDRQGNINYVSLRQKTGYAALDAAVLDMVQRANPVPPVPEDYPVTDAFLEFLVPVNFKIEKI